MLNRKSALLASLIVLSATACTPTAGPSAPQPSASTSTSPDPNASVAPSANPSSNPSSSPASNPSAQPSASSGGVQAGAQSQLIVTGESVFESYAVNYRPGMKWVYKMSLAPINIAAPSLPGGISLPPGVSVPGISTGATDLGELVTEVVKVEGNLVTLRSEVKATAATSFPAPAASETTFEVAKSSQQYAAAFYNGEEGTLDWQKAASGESITVPAGSYTADRISGVMKIKAQGADLQQNIKLWMSSGVGMVKEEVQSSTSAAGFSSDTTTVIELKSFTG